jgi:predicted SAM-dependent methyltransferase
LSRDLNVYKDFKQFIYHLLIPFIRIYKYLSWGFYLLTCKEVKIIVGAGPTKYKGWFSTDIVTLDVTKESDFQKYFSQKKIRNVLAEHVLEHLNNEELENMIKNFYKYSDDKINIRIAVPDGFHQDEKYISVVKPGGTGEGALEHINIFNVNSLSSLFERFGFIAHPVEYWNENKIFHQGYSDDQNGYVIRSFKNDKRNLAGQPIYTSLIIDFKKN